MTHTYSAFNVVKEGPDLQDEYDIVIIGAGAGGHGLATAFHLARDHSFTRVAVSTKDGSVVGTPGQLDSESLELLLPAKCGSLRSIGSDARTFF